jgi:hypothetical protein
LAVAADHAEIASGDAHDMHPIIDLGETDELTGQRLADEDELAPPLDLAGVAHAANLVVRVVPGIGEARRQGASGRLPSRGRCRLADRPVRALHVEARPKPVEARLLLGDRGRCWRRGLGLESSVYALVPAVILRARLKRGSMTSFSQHTESTGEATRAARAERLAVVRTDRAGKPDARENPLQRPSERAIIFVPFSRSRGLF